MTGVLSETGAASHLSVPEVGTVTTGQSGPNQWHDVQFQSEFTDPVVLMGPVSYAGAQPGHVRLRNVNQSGFEFRIEEWAYQDGQHASEQLFYVAFEANRDDKHAYWANHDIKTGRRRIDHRFGPVALEGYQQIPVVFAKSQTFNGSDPIVERLRSVDQGGFEVRVQEQDRGSDRHTTETVGWLALEPGHYIIQHTGLPFEVGRSDPVGHEWQTIEFDQTYVEPLFLGAMQTFQGFEAGGLRYRDLGASSVDVRIQEETSEDEETRHTPETVGYMVAEGNKRSLRGTGFDLDGPAEAGTVTVSQNDRSEAHTVATLHSYSEPVVFVGPVSYARPQPCHARVLRVGDKQFEFQLEEWPYLDGHHVTERVHYVVAESGTYDLFSSGPAAGIGTVMTNDVWRDVSQFVRPGIDPVVFTQAQTYNGPDPIVTRARNVRTTRFLGDWVDFDVRVQEQQDGVDDHVRERIGYVVLDTGTYTSPGRTAEVGKVADGVTDDWFEIEFETEFRSPWFVADIQSFDGGDPAGLRYRNLTGSSVEVFVEEETSANSDVSHVAETVGYLAMEFR